MEQESVKFIRLNTGEDLISEVAEVKSGDDWYFTLYNPLKIVYTMGSKPGILSVAMMQWVFPKVVSEQVFNIYPNDVITMANANENFVDYYWDCVDHFERIREKQSKNIEFADRPISQYEEIEDEDFGLDQLKDILDSLQGNANNKGRLH